MANTHTPSGKRHPKPRPVHKHHRVIWVVAALTLAVVLAIVKEHTMAKLTLAAISEEFAKLVADVVSDKLFNLE